MIAKITSLSFLLSPSFDACSRCGTGPHVWKRRVLLLLVDVLPVGTNDQLPGGDFADYRSCCHGVVVPKPQTLTPNPQTLRGEYRDNGKENGSYHLSYNLNS